MAAVHVGGKDDFRLGGVFLDMERERKAAVGLFHHQVGDHNVVLVGGERFFSLGTIFRHGHGGAVGLQSIADFTRVNRIAVHQKNLAVFHYDEPLYLFRLD